MKEFHIEKGWEKTLEALGLASLEDMLAFRNDDCESEHRRGATYRIPLPGLENDNLFLKCDYFTHKKEILKDLLQFRRPCQNSVKERIAFDYARNAGFIVPEVVAWGRISEWGLPSKAAMLMREIHGTSLWDLIVAEKEGEYVAAAENLLRRMFACGFDWPDYKPEHFIVTPDGRIALIDLERMRFVGASLSDEDVATRIAFFHRRVEMTRAWIAKPK